MAGALVHDPRSPWRRRWYLRVGPETPTRVAGACRTKPGRNGGARARSGEGRAVRPGGGGAAPTRGLVTGPRSRGAYIGFIQHAISHIQ